MERLLKVLFGEYPAHGIVYLNSKDYPRMEKLDNFDVSFKTLDIPGYKGRVWSSGSNRWHSKNHNKDTRVVCIDDDVPEGFARVKLLDNSWLKIQL